MDESAEWRERRTQRTWRVRWRSEMEGDASRHSMTKIERISGVEREEVWASRAERRASVEGD